MVFGTRILKHWVLGPSGSYCILVASMYAQATADSAPRAPHGSAPWRTRYADGSVHSPKGSTWTPTACKMMARWALFTWMLAVVLHTLGVLVCVSVAFTWLLKESRGLLYIMRHEAVVHRYHRALWARLAYGQLSLDLVAFIWSGIWGSFPVLRAI